MASGENGPLRAILSLNILRTGAGERADTVGADGVGATRRGILTLIDIKAAYSETNARENQIHLALL